MSFREGSYIELLPPKITPSVSLNISLSLATTRQTGVILYIGDEQHLSVELFRGRVRVSVDVGNYPVSTMFSYETVSDGRYHTLEWTLIAKNVTMRVDSGLTRTIVNDGHNQYLNTKSSLFIGGLPSTVADNAVKKWHIWNASSLRGKTAF